LQPVEVAAGEVELARALLHDRKRVLALLSGVPQLRPGLALLGCKGVGVEHGDDLAGLHPISLAHADVRQPSGELGRDVHLGGLDSTVAHRKALGHGVLAQKTAQPCGQLPRIPAGHQHPTRCGQGEKNHENGCRDQPTAS
jgi:hypothetical protein